MKLQDEGQTQKRATLTDLEAKEVGNPGSIQRLIRLVSESSVVFCICCCTLRAEEQVTYQREGSQRTSTIYFSSYSRPGAVMLSLSPETAGLMVLERLSLPDDWRLDRLLPRDASQMDLKHDSSVMLFVKRMPSRYSYHVWAGVGTGYGQIFRTDTFWRSRTNGAGIQDPDWLYLKMSVRL